ncbi:hypothetical protein [Propionicicella superfundia]|nr:hypothetical protein [Propionicicella superfundia]
MALASARRTPDALLWTRDTMLRTAAASLDLAWDESPRPKS